MAILKSNPFVGEFEGTLGNMVLAKHKPGEKVARTRPVRTSPPTAGEIAVRRRFALATAYARQALAQPEIRAVYVTAARIQRRRAINLATADFLRRPVVVDIQATGYRGAIGEVIRIKAIDHVRVAAVQVEIRDLAGGVLEKGPATPEGMESEDWTYTAQTSLAPGQTVVIAVAAVDLPGNSAMKQIDHALLPAG